MHTRQPGFSYSACGQLMNIKGVLLQWFINFLDEKTSGVAIKNENTSHQELAEELYKPITRKFEKWKAYPTFITNLGS